ncbi:flagellar biosynthesis protein FlhF [Pseudomonas sp. NW5]|uniref:flagellar biosynthesis protein FlhF n=1 Tax=Pseudomonas sp. NW5 TaxID=2934934 RepID=UPI002020D8B0|nr:flagellar biosynthesis protein FlhF [Pseudomonas sp. NW5]MCL7461896.1 flagellar biosynthesis protein FlhF [Pseudomonas sp. NW5]
MSVRRFFGANSRDVMRQVRAALGDDALILSNRSTPEGVEILAMADDAHRQLAGDPPPASPPPPAAAPAPSGGLPPRFGARPGFEPAPTGPARPFGAPASAEPPRFGAASTGEGASAFADSRQPPAERPFAAESAPGEGGFVPGGVSAYQRAASMAAYAAQTPPLPVGMPPSAAPAPAAPMSAPPAPPAPEAPARPDTSAAPPPPSAAFAAEALASPHAPVDFAALSERLFSELQSMRELLNRQASSAATRTDCGGQLYQRLLSAGFGPLLASEVLAALPGELADAPADAPPVLAWLERQLAARLPVLDDEAALLDAGGVIALVGPTGVGKTTTTAKLAARYVMRHGGSQVALVTTDSFRIGAHEQLRIYARLLGVEVYALAADAPLDELLRQLASKRLVIIDTVGMSQRDQRLLTQIGQLGAAGRPIRLMLLLNAASHGDTLEEVVDIYQRAALAAGSVLSDCIVSKCDEAARLGSVLDILIRHGLRLNYVATGQQVPEDLQLAEALPLMRQALAVSQASPFVQPDRAPANAAQRLEALSRGLLGQGRALATTLDTLRREIDGFALLESAWSLGSLPRSLQGERLAQMLAALDAGSPPTASTLLWGRSTAVSGAGWQMPLLGLDTQGDLQVRPWLMHQLPAGQERRLQWALQQLGTRRHLLSAPPDAPALAELQVQRSAWMAPARASSRVEYQGMRHTLAQLQALASAQHNSDLRHRGRTLRLQLARLPVQIRPAGSRQGAAALTLQAWFGRLHDEGEARPAAMRYWLAWSSDESAAGLAGQVEDLRRQLALDDLPSLTLRAWQALADANHPLQQELRLFLAAGLAATASRLEQAEGDWAMDVRAQLLNLSGSRKPRSAAQQLEALLHLLTARDALQRMGSQGGIV